MDDRECIFCRTDASSSKSVEHIVPESLGNRSHVLRRGTVCDGCNSYFAVKIEKPLLESDWFTMLRFEQNIPSKRGRIPPIRGVHVQTNIEVAACKTTAGPAALEVVDPSATGRFLASIADGRRHRVYFRVPASPPIQLLERLMAKCGLEMLAARVCEHPGWRDGTVMRRELDPVRRFARFGEGGRWPVHVRRIYDSNKLFLSECGEAEQILHECDLLYTDRAELYAVLALFGMEFVINLVGPELDGYLDWLSRHDRASPLYTRQGRFRPDA